MILPPSPISMLECMFAIQQSFEIFLVLISGPFFISPFSPKMVSASSVRPDPASHLNRPSIHSVPNWQANCFPGMWPPWLSIQADFFYFYCLIFPQLQNLPLVLIRWPWTYSPGETGGLPRAGEERSGVMDLLTAVLQTSSGRPSSFCF